MGLKTVELDCQLAIRAESRSVAGMNGFRRLCTPVTKL